ncbi:MAG: amidohydrolase family protein [Microbacterium sp.]|uniref:amidohydrolase family protein n=1 Tax=Microbacterium sp. TaxID=51671 RepID=UPI0039E52691
MRVDVHSHYNPPAFWSYYERLGAYEQEGTFFARVPRGGSLDDPTLEARIETLDAAGVDVEVLSVSATQPYFRPREMAVDAARYANDLYHEAVRSFPGRFEAFGCLPLPHVDESLQELARCYDELGFVGINLGCSVIGEPIDAPFMDPIWEELNRREAVVYLHPGSENAIGVGGGDFHLDADFGSPAELAICATRLVITGVTTRYPKIKFVLATLGGSLAFLAHRVDKGFWRFYRDRYEELGGILSHLRRSFWYDTSVCEEPLAILAAKEAFGVDQLIFGSDAPRIRPPLEALEYLQRSAYLTESEVHTITDVTGAALLGLSGRK